MDELGTLDTLGAVIPVRAVQALVTHAIDELVTAITDCGVADISSRSAKTLSKGPNGGVFRSRLEGVSRMVSVLAIDVARHAEVVIFAVDTCDELVLGEDWFIR